MYFTKNKTKKEKSNHPPRFYGKHIILSRCLNKFFTENGTIPAICGFMININRKKFLKDRSFGNKQIEFGAVHGKVLTWLSINV